MTHLQCFVAFGCGWIWNQAVIPFVVLEWRLAAEFASPPFKSRRRIDALLNIGTADFTLLGIVLQMPRALIHREGGKAVATQLIDFRGCIFGREIVTTDAVNVLSPVKEHHQPQVDGRVLIRLAHRAPPVSWFMDLGVGSEGIRTELALCLTQWVDSSRQPIHLGCTTATCSNAAHGAGAQKPTCLHRRRQGRTNWSRTGSFRWPVLQ